MQFVSEVNEMKKEEPKVFFYYRGSKMDIVNITEEESNKVGAKMVQSHDGISTYYIKIVNNNFYDPDEHSNRDVNKVTTNWQKVTAVCFNEYVRFLGDRRQSTLARSKRSVRNV